MRLRTSAAVALMLASRPTDESVLAAHHRPAMPTHSTSVLKRTFLYAPAGTLTKLFWQPIHRQRSPRTRPRCSRGCPCTRQQASRRICSCSASTSSDARVLALDVEEDILVLVSRHTDGSILAAHPRAAMPARSPRCSRRCPCTRQQPHRRSCSCGASARAATLALSTSVFTRMPLYSPADTPANLFLQRIQGRRCLRTQPRCSRGYPGTRSRHTDESVLAAPPRAATPAHSTSVFKRMSLYSPAGTPTNLFLQRIHGQRCPRTRPRCSRGRLCTRQRTHRRICSGSASTASDARALDRGVQEDVLALASTPPDESVLALHPRAEMPVYSTSGSKRISLYAPAGTPTNLFRQRIKGQRCLRTRPRRSRGYPGTRSRHTDESVLPALPRAATPALTTSVFKRMSLHSPAGTPTNPFWQRIRGPRCLRTRPRCSRGYPGTRSRHPDESVLAAPPTGSDACALDLGVQEDVLVLASRYTDESVLPACPRAAMPTYSTPVFKTMSLYSPAGPAPGKRRLREVGHVRDPPLRHVDQEVAAELW